MVGGHVPLFKLDENKCSKFEICKKTSCVSIRPLDLSYPVLLAYKNTFGPFWIDNIFGRGKFEER